MVQTWGKVPEYKGRGRPPKKKRPLGGWKYLQVIKERNEKDRVTGTKKKAIFGEEETLLEIFEEHTAYVERTDPGVAADERTADQDLSVQRASASQRSFQCTGQLPVGKTPSTT